MRREMRRKNFCCRRVKGSKSIFLKAAKLCLTMGKVVERKCEECHMNFKLFTRNRNSQSLKLFNFFFGSSLPLDGKSFKF